MPHEHAEHDQSAHARVLVVDDEDNITFLLSSALSDTPTTEEQTREERHATLRTEFAAALAEELGLDADTVEAALENVATAMAEARAAERRAQLEERLDAAVQAGQLTREQADALLAADEAGVLRGFGGPKGHGPPWPRRS